MAVFITAFMAYDHFQEDFTSEVEIFRAANPGGKMEAVMIKTNSGATTPYGYRLYVGSIGFQPIEGNEVFKATHLEDWKVSWVNDKVLDIQYQSAKIYLYRNYEDFQGRKFLRSEKNEEVEILLSQTYTKKAIVGENR